MKKEIFDSLAKLTPELVAGTTIPKQSPTAEISGELAFCLETLMNTVGKQMNLSPNTVLEKILATGIEGWVAQLPEKTKRFIGLNATIQQNAIASADDLDDDDPDPAHAQQAAYAALNESYGYTPLTAHAVNKSRSTNGGRGDQRNGGSGGKKSSRPKNVRNAGKKHPPKKSNARRRRYSQNKPQPLA
jgi:hypothetical protein